MTYPAAGDALTFIRWKVEVPGIGTVKGISEADARETAHSYDGTVWMSRVHLVVFGPDKGREILDPWEVAPPVDPDAEISAYRAVVQAGRRQAAEDILAVSASIRSIPHRPGRPVLSDHQIRVTTMRRCARIADPDVRLPETTTQEQE